MRNFSDHFLQSSVEQRSFQIMEKRASVFTAKSGMAFACFRSCEGIRVGLEVCNLRLHKQRSPTFENNKKRDLEVPEVTCRVGSSHAPFWTRIDLESES